MLKNYIKIAYRNLLRHKVYTFINLTGLAVGMACCLLIALYVQDELSYDRYHEKADHIYRVLHAYRPGAAADSLPAPAPAEYQVWGNAPVGPALQTEFPEIEKVVQFTHPYELLFQHEDKRFKEARVVFIDSTVFEVFSWKLLAGNPARALVEPGSIVISESVARKYFGNENPMGRHITIENEFPAVVTGVMADIPANSHFTFDVFVSMSTFRQMNPGIFDMWGYVDFFTYFVLGEQAAAGRLEAKIPQFLARHSKMQQEEYTIAFEPLEQVYLHSEADRQPGTTGSLNNLYIFSSIAAFMLLIACINFMNLATARSAERAKEVGVRKVIGAQQSGLVLQFLTESVVLSLLAAGLALVLAILLFPAFQQLSGKAFSHHMLLSWQVLLLVLGAALLVGVLAGSYPAWMLTRFRPVLVLKGIFSSSSRGIALRKGLVVFQFSLSMVLIAGTAVVFSQLHHLRTKDLGFRQDQMLVLETGNDESVAQRIESIKALLMDHPAVHSASASRAVPGEFIPNAYTEVQEPQGQMKGDNPLLYEIDFDFIPHFGIEMVAGRAYSRDFPADTAKSLLLNEAAARMWGYDNPADAVGKKFSQWGREGTIIGVVKDFNFRSLHTRVEPLALRLAPRETLSRISLEVEADQLPATIKQLEQIWTQQVPQRPFLYTFLDESFNLQYQSDQRFGQLFSVFAGLTIFIACLGLLGLVSYTAEKRAREIGIRKVLGASVASIVTLLAKDFLQLVLIAAIIAFPVAWYAMHQWLQDFPYRIDIPLWVFGAAGLLAAGVAFITISFQAIKAARANPVKNLRTE